MDSFHRPFRGYRNKIFSAQKTIAARRGKRRLADPRIQLVEDRAKLERIESDPPELPEVMPQV